MNEQYINALVLTGEGAGGLNRKIESSITSGEPIELPLLREAFAVESRSLGSRASVCNILAREIRRQEMTMVAA